jgi:pyridinium-3,5-bisthiocarboxylic acid mononucleotide nickel chelatase
VREPNSPLLHRHGEHEPHAGHAHAHAHAVAEHHHVAALADDALQLQREPLAPGAGQGQVLYFDAFSGAGGDMCVAALVDLGVPFAVIEKAVGALGLSGVRVAVYAAQAGAIGALGFDVHVHGEQPQRSYAQIRELLAGAELAPSVRELAGRIFARLARAEARVHRVAVEAVHFHEVGAADSLADIVAVAAALDYLGAEVVCSELPLGRGFVHCQHGVIPIPAPATVLCLEGLWSKDTALEFELVTPTAAAVLGEVARPGHWPRMRAWRSGWGAGTRVLPDRPNALRVVLGEPLDAKASEPRAAGQGLLASHQLIETNLDDASGELVGHALSALLGAGALDAWAVPCTMKKGRPGWVLCALGVSEQAGAIADVMLRETPAIGVRFSACARQELQRTLRSVETRFGMLHVKVSGTGDHAHAKPEFDECRALAEQHRVPVRVVWEAALAALLAPR